MMRSAVLFFIVVTLPEFIFAQLPLPTPKFQPDTIYMVESNAGLSAAIDRRHYFQYQYESFTKSTDEYYYQNLFTTSGILTLETAGQEWRYFRVRRKPGSGNTQIEFRMNDVNFSRQSEPVVFNVTILPSRFDSLSTRMNRSFFPQGIPGKKWVLFSIPNNDFTLDVDLKSFLAPLGESSDTHRLYAIDEKGKTKNVTKESELFVKKLDVMSAYWFKTNLTEDKFHLNIPFTGNRGGGIGYIPVKGWRAFGVYFDYPVYWLRRDDVRVWSFNPDTQTWREISELEPLYPWAGYVAFSPDSGGISTYNNFGVNYDLVRRSSATETVRKSPSSFTAKASLIIDKDTLRFGFTSYSSDKADFWDTPLMPSAPEIKEEPAYFVESGKALTENYKSEQLFWQLQETGYNWNLVLPKGKHTLTLDSFEGFDVNSSVIFTGKSLYRELRYGEPVLLDLNESVTATLSIGKKEILSERLVPQQVELFPAYPNPFNPTATVSFSLPTAQQIEIGLIDVAGRLVKTILNREIQAGYHQLQLNAAELSSGIYMIRMKSENKVLIQKVVLVK